MIQFTSIKKVAMACLLLGVTQVFCQTPQWLFPNTTSTVNSLYFPPPMQSTSFPTATYGLTNSMITDAAGNRLFAVIDDEGFDEVNGSFGNMAYYEINSIASPHVGTCNV